MGWFCVGGCWGGIVRVGGCRLSLALDRSEGDYMLLLSAAGLWWVSREWDFIGLWGIGLAALI